jgi:NO-binding membrane sensor protein with MHYT domain
VLVLGGVSMGSLISAMHLFGAIAVTFIGMGFFFAIVGVFGLPAAILALVLFIALAFVLFRRPQAEGIPR